MNIDWFTFFAQIVNFLVLVALLRWVLYDKVVNAMNEREEKIAERLKEADRKESEAQEEAQRYRELRSKLETEREQRIQEASNAAEEKKQELLKQAEEQIEHKREQWKESYLQKREEFLDDLRKQVGTAGLQAARHTLVQLANADLESAMYNSFINDLEEIDSSESQKIQEQIESDRSELQIRSAFEVPEEQQEKLQDAIQKCFNTDAPTTFSHEPELICGLDLNAGGFRMGWNVREYLSELELEFDKQLKSNEGSS